MEIQWDMMKPKSCRKRAQIFPHEYQANVEPFFGSCFISLHSVAQMGEPNWPPIPQDVVLGGCHFQNPEEFNLCMWT